MPADLPALGFNGWLRWDVVDRLLRALPIESVLEIGAGQGGFGARLARRWRYVGVEPDATSAAVAAARVKPHGGAVLNGTTALVDDGERFDLVCAFEVLEHLEDDVAAVADWTSRVRDGGWLMLSVPAHAGRMGRWDAAVGHFRRYDRSQLEALLKAAGLTAIVVTAYGFPLGYVLEAGRNALAGDEPTEETMDLRTSASGRRLQPGGRLGIVTRLATAPFRLLQRPFAATNLGTGFVAVGRRRGSTSGAPTASPAPGGRPHR